ncbi:hypothetical protein AAG570_007050 [Ranatra chinensis]|uniref:Uncharacterized protein n=1 Tax=Ranatra chinensis TaxID=642074 RepID=A0ABD0YGI5_9HEMI
MDLWIGRKGGGSKYRHIAALLDPSSRLSFLAETPTTLKVHPTSRQPTSKCRERRRLLPKGGMFYRKWISVKGVSLRCAHRWFDSAKQLSRTKVHNKTSRKLFVSDQSDYRTTQLNRMKGHESRPTAERQYLSDQCDYRTTLLSELNQSRHSGLHHRCRYRTNRQSELEKTLSRIREDFVEESADGVPADNVRANAGCRHSPKMLPTREAKRWKPHSRTTQYTPEDSALLNTKQGTQVETHWLVPVWVISSVSTQLPILGNTSRDPLVSTCLGDQQREYAATHLSLPLCIVRRAVPAGPFYGGDWTLSSAVCLSLLRHASSYTSSCSTTMRSSNMHDLTLFQVSRVASTVVKLIARKRSISFVLRLMRILRLMRLYTFFVRIYKGTLIRMLLLLLMLHGVSLRPPL